MKSEDVRMFLITVAVGCCLSLFGPVRSPADVLLQSNLAFGEKDSAYFFIESEAADDLGTGWKLTTDPALVDYCVHAEKEPDPVTGAYGGMAINNRK